MKTKLQRQSGLLAALLTLSALTSCGSSGSTDTSASGVSGVTSAPSNEPAETTYAALEEKDFGGETVNIMLRSEWLYEFVVEEETGDTVSDAIFRRNRAVEDKYGVKLNFIDFKGDWSNHDAFATTIHNSVLAADGEYDFIMGYQAAIPQNVVGGDLLDLNTVPYLELSAPWWLQEGLEALTVNGKCYEVGGDIGVTLLEGINCMFFNKSLANDYKTPDLYELARGGEWTHEKMAEVTKGIYRDLNSDAARDLGDAYGLITRQALIRSYLVSYDTPTISGDGEVIWYNERTVNVVEELVDFFTVNDNWWTASETEAQKIFSEGRALLINTTLGASAQMRAMEDDFGIIPYPKFDDMESYKATTSNEVSMVCVPITAPDLDKTGFIIEAMCRESTDTVSNAFYNVALQGKYARDEQSLEMISLIRGTISFDFGWINSHVAGVSGAQYEIMVREGNKNFASWYATNEPTIKADVAKLLEKYK